MHAFAKVRYSNERVLGPLVPLAVSRLDEMAGKHVAAFAWACHMLGVEDPQVFIAIGKRALEVSDEFGATGFGNLLDSLHKTGAYNSSVFDDVLKIGLLKVGDMNPSSVG